MAMAGPPGRTRRRGISAEVVSRIRVGTAVGSRLDLPWMVAARCQYEPRCLGGAGSLVAWPAGRENSNSHKGVPFFGRVPQGDASRAVRIVIQSRCVLSVVCAGLRARAAGGASGEIGCSGRRPAHRLRWVGSGPGSPGAARLGRAGPLGIPKKSGGPWPLQHIP